MQNAKKFVLLDQTTYDKRTSRELNFPTDMPSAPSASVGGEKQLTQFEHEMRSVLDSNEPDDVKAKLYTQALNKLKTLTQPSTRGGESSTNYVVTDEEILESVPPTVRHKARRLLRFVRDFTSMNWSDRGELVYKQATVPNSNIIELVNDVLRQKSSDRAVGWREFASGLGSASVKISRDLITNNDSWKIIEGRSSSTDDVVNLSSIFQETTPARRSAATRQSRELTSTKRKPKRQQRYGTWVEY